MMCRPALYEERWRSPYTWLRFMKIIIKRNEDREQYAAILQYFMRNSIIQRNSKPNEKCIRPLGRRVVNRQTSVAHAREEMKSWLVRLVRITKIWSTISRDTIHWIECKQPLIENNRRIEWLYLPYAEKIILYYLNKNILSIQAREVNMAIDIELAEQINRQ